MATSTVPSIVETYEKGATIFTMGAHDDMIYYLESGFIKLLAIGLEGWEKTLIVLKPGNIFGEASLAKKPHTYAAQAMSRCEVRKVHRDRWLAAAYREPTLAIEALNSLSKRIRYLNYSTTVMSFSNAQGKLAYVIYSLFQQQCNVVMKNGHPSIKISHEELGRMAGMCRVSVTKTIAQFKEAGIVEPCGRSLVLKDAQKLEFLIIDRP